MSNVSVTVSQSLVKELEWNKDGDSHSVSLGVHYIAVDTRRYEVGNSKVVDSDRVLLL